MSIVIKKEPKEKNGHLIITSQDDHLNGEDYVMRVNALINLLQGQNEDYNNPDDRYFVLEILRDMMPNIKQANELLKISPH